MLLKLLLGLVLVLLVGRVSAGLFQKKSEKPDAQGSNPFPQLNFLEDSVANEYDIFRLSGYPAGNIRHIPYNNTFIIPTSLRFNAWVNLWRVNSRGIVVDSFSPDGEYEGNLPASGIFFRKENYIDWAFTGDKSPKRYLQTFNAKSLGKEKIAEILAQAKQIVWTKEIYYEQVYRGSIETDEFQYFLKMPGGWSILLSPVELSIEEFPPLKFALRDSFSNEYQGPPLGINIVEPTMFDVKSPESPIRLVEFKKLGESKSGFMDINSSAWVGDYGLGHFQLVANTEVIDFKSFHRVLKNGTEGGHDEPDMTYYGADKLNSDSALAFLILNTGRAPSRDDVELGSYIIRNKITAEAISKLASSERSFVENTQKKYQLGISVKGLEAVQSNVYWMTYFNGKSESLANPNTWIYPVDTRSIPMEVRGSFELPVNPKKKSLDDTGGKKNRDTSQDNKYYSFALKLNEQYFTWSDVSNIHYALHFDYMEVEKILRDLSKTNEAINVALHFSFVPGGVELHVVLSNSSASYRLKHVRFASVASQEMSKSESLFIFDQKLIEARDAIAKEHKPYGLEGPPAESIPAALMRIRKIVDESEYPSKLSSSVVDASWFLLNGAISAKDEQLKLDVVNNYVLNLFPKMDDVAPSADFIRRAVDLGIDTNNDALLSNVNNAFFSPKTKVNYDKNQWLLEDKMLNQSFKTALFNLAYAENYIWLSSKVFANNMNIEKLSPEIANHYSKLLLKSLNEKKLDMATKLSESFIELIYPTIGYSEKSTDVVSSIIVTGAVTKNEKLLERVMSKFVNNQNYNKGNNNILYYNLACYYALRGDKANMLSAIKSSIEYGHDTVSFTKDSDFDVFKNDADFLAALEPKAKGH